MARLILGPMLRHTGERTAAVWVETDRPGVVRVLDRSAPTFTVHGHHYALVEIDGLAPGSSTPYTVTLDDEVVWPAPGSSLPPSRIRTLPADATRLRLAFGSCRHPGTPETHGHDPLHLLARRLRGADDGGGDGGGAAATDPAPGGDAGSTAGTAGTGPGEGDDGGWPSALLLVGDQVYADRPPEELHAFATSRRQVTEPPYHEVADFEEYAQLYRLAWSTDEEVRWLLSTVPTYMIFDDHDIRDDWNTSYAWREEIRASPWWRRRITGGLGAYWIYQHLGNLSSEARAADPVYAALTATPAATPGDRPAGHASPAVHDSHAVDDRAAAGDRGAVLDAFAERTDRDPRTTRWSYACDFGRTRMVAIDSRCGRVLEADRRAMLDEAEMSWVDGRIRGDADHLLVVSSLPYLLPAAVHHGEAWNEALCRGAWGNWLVSRSERLRQRYDLEHWAAFRGSFAALAGSVLAAARGDRGRPPATISFLSGDVHFSYLARVTRPTADSTITQIVCSPLRNPLKRSIRWINKIAALRFLGPPARLVARLAGVPAPPLRWRLDGGLRFHNAIAMIDIDRRTARVRWEAATVRGELTEVARAELSHAPGAASP